MPARSPKSSPAFQLAPGSGLAFEQLYDRAGLIELDTFFVDSLRQADPELAQRLLAARIAPNSLDHKEESDLLMALAGHLDDFLAHLFAIEKEVSALAASHHALAPLYKIKRQRWNWDRRLA